MSVHTSFNQAGPKTAIVRFEKRPIVDQGTNPTFKVKTDPAIDTVKAFIGFLFGFAPFDATPEPRFPAPQAPSHASHGIVFRFSGPARKDETAVVMHTLLAVFCFDGPFVFHFTERHQPTARPEPSPSSPTIERSAPRKTARTADSDLWHQLPSRAGQAALGVPPSRRQSIDDELKKLRKERIASIETAEAPLPDHLAEQAGNRTERIDINETEGGAHQSVDQTDNTRIDVNDTHRPEASNETAIAALPGEVQMHQAPLDTPDVGSDSQTYMQRLQAAVAATTDGTPEAIEAAMHRQYLEELRNPKVAV